MQAHSSLLAGQSVWSLFPEIQGGESALVAGSPAVVRGNLKRRRLVGAERALRQSPNFRSRSGKVDASDGVLFEKADC